ncbi:MAG: hypothetical protein WDN49_22995 [Acetobacteraceae bacterium]
MEATSIYDPLHPAVLRLIQMTVEAARAPRHSGLRLRRDGGQCPLRAAAARHGPAQLQHERHRRPPRVKQSVRNARLAACEAFAMEVMAQTEPQATADLVRRFDERR